MDTAIFEQARLARDPRFDGRFFIGVKTTGIYCRPVCPVKQPRAENILYFPTAAAAAEAGFRPCLRCRPEAAPGTPAWAGTSTTVTRGLRLINDGALDEGSVAQLSERLGITPRHLSRLFLQHLGASPKAVAQTRRLQFAKKLLDETALPVTDIALAAGYGSVRRFNDHFRQVYRRPPSALRKTEARSAASSFSLRLPYRPPFDFRTATDFLAARAIPGVEQVSVQSYQRHFRIGDEVGSLSVTHLPEARQLRCDIDLPDARWLMPVVQRVRGLFDLDCDPREIAAHLAHDPLLAEAVHRHPGKRVPGCWDPFEIAVRAVVGQQVSVRAATTVMGEIVRRCGEAQGEARLFPAPAALAALPPEALPMPRARAQALVELARRVACGEIALHGAESGALVDQLRAVPGIGPWTANYIAMRSGEDPDAFIEGDLVLAKVAREKLGIATPRALLRHAERWRPWRAYAVMHLWAMASP